jgi:hypothetical protein
MLSWIIEPDRFPNRSGGTTGLNCFLGSCLYLAWMYVCVSGHSTEYVCVEYGVEPDTLLSTHPHIHIETWITSPLADSMWPVEVPLKRKREKILVYLVAYVCPKRSGGAGLWADRYLVIRPQVHRPPCLCHSATTTSIIIIRRLRSPTGRQESQHFCSHHWSSIAASEPSHLTAPPLFSLNLS